MGDRLVVEAQLMLPHALDDAPPHNAARRGLERAVPDEQPRAHRQLRRDGGVWLWWWYGLQGGACGGLRRDQSSIDELGGGGAAPPHGTLPASAGQGRQLDHWRLEQHLP